MYGKMFIVFSLPTFTHGKIFIVLSMGADTGGGGDGGDASSQSESRRGMSPPQIMIFTDFFKELIKDFRFFKIFKIK